jgi:hypothetical protein
LNVAAAAQYSFDAAAVADRKATAMTVRVDSSNLSPQDLHDPDAPDVASIVAGTQPDKSIDVPLAHIADDAYKVNGEPTQIGQWQRLTPQGDHLLDAEGQAVDIDPSLLEDPASGFRAAVYSDGQGNYVVGFAGTDPKDLNGDGRTDVQQGIGVTTVQYARAEQLGRQVQALAGPGHVAFTGHSLGGGLAAAATLATGETGVTFNAAGLSNETIRDLGYDNPNAVRERYQNNGQLRSYAVEGEPLTAAVDLGAPAQLGTPWNLPTDASPLDVIGLHNGYVEALEQSTPTPGIDGNDVLEVAGQTTFGMGPAGDLAREVAPTVVNTALGELGNITETGQNLETDAQQVFARTFDDLGGAFSRPEPIPRAIGALADGALDGGGSLVQRGSELAGKTVTAVTDGVGTEVRDIGDDLGLDPGFVDGVASGVEDAGSGLRDGLEGFGNSAETVADGAGDLLAEGANTLADAKGAVDDWAQRTLDPSDWF